MESVRDFTRHRSCFGQNGLIWNDVSPLYITMTHQQRCQVLASGTGQTTEGNGAGCFSRPAESADRAEIFVLQRRLFTIHSYSQVASLSVRGSCMTHLVKLNISHAILVEVISGLHFAWQIRTVTCQTSIALLANQYAKIADQYLSLGKRAYQYMSLGELVSRPLKRILQMRTH